MNNAAAKHDCSVAIPAALLALLLCFSGASFAQAIAAIDFETPRAFGYTIGDRIRHEMTLGLRAPYEFDQNTLPETGRLNRWLEISAAAVTVQSSAEIDTYRIVIDYQIFNVPKQLESVTIPQLEFILSGGTDPLPVFMPEWSFSIAPVATPGPRPALRLQPDKLPLPIGTTARRSRLWVSAVLFSGLLAYLAYWRWVLPRRQRGRYPFSNALRELQGLEKSAAVADRYKLGLRSFHAAINATAQHVVFDGNLREFVAENSQYATLEVELTEFFARSSEVFFDDAAVASPAAALQELIGLCRRCRTLERSVA